MVKHRLLLLYYPLIFFFCWFWSLLRRAWNVFSPDGEAPIVIIGFQIFFGNMYGFANAMMYGWIIRHHLMATSQIYERTNVNSITTNDQNNSDEEDDNL